MEVVIGFAVGYYIGTRQGRKGLQDAIESAQAIMASPEAQRLLGQAISTFQTVAGSAMEGRDRRSGGSTRAALISSVVDEFIERRSRRAA